MQHMPNSTLAPPEFPGNVDLPHTALVESDRSFSVGLGEPWVPDFDPAFLQESDHGATGQSVSICQLPAARSGLVLSYQPGDFVITESLLDAEGNEWLSIRPL